MGLRQYRVELLSIIIILFSILLIFTQRQLQDRKLSSNLRTRDKTATKVRVGNKTNSEEQPIVTLIATGDVMLGRSVNIQTLKSKDPHFPLRKIKDLLKSADVVYINLENPLVDPCSETDDGMIFCAPLSVAKTLSFASVDVANLSNNHTRNYGQSGYNSTIKSLGKESILYSDSENIAKVRAGSSLFGFVGFDLVSKDWVQEDLIEKVVSADRLVDVLVVGFHWGSEYNFKPTNKQKNLARLAVDAGADLIIGHHPHVVQPIEVYKSVPIVYSLGNFVFDQMWSEETREGVIGKFYFKDSKVYDYEFVPIYIKEIGQPEVVLDKERSERIFSRLGI